MKFKVDNEIITVEKDQYWFNNELEYISEDPCENIAIVSSIYIQQIEEEVIDIKKPIHNFSHIVVRYPYTKSISFMRFNYSLKEFFNMFRPATITEIDKLNIMDIII